MEFMQPSEAKAIPTYRVMNQYGDIIDKDVGVETTDEEALQLYKNMVKRQSSSTVSKPFN
jgi:2-oxoisovalerate dehydrogenase E1 component alpha subunit